MQATAAQAADMLSGKAKDAQGVAQDAADNTNGLAQSAYNAVKAYADKAGQTIDQATAYIMQACSIYGSLCLVCCDWTSLHRHKASCCAHLPGV